MRTPRFYTERRLDDTGTISLEAPASHHLKRVLRLRTGQPVLLFNGDGQEYRATVVGCEAGEVTVRVEAARAPERESRLRIHLGQGISRGERMDLVLQKSVELGVASLAPLWTRRSQVRLSGQRLDKRMAHWRGVIRAACEQSGRVRLPPLGDAAALETWLDETAAMPLKLVLDPAAPLQLRELAPEPDVLVLIGPEGGLEDGEIDACVAAGFQRVRLGPRTLRTETAALAALAALQALWGDLCE